MPVHEMNLTMEEQLLTRAAAVQRPVTGSLELLPLCNLSCDMCYIRRSVPEMKQEGELLSSQQWLGIARGLQQEGVLFLQLTGGEPLMHPEFKEIYCGLLEMGFILTINTNGTLLDASWADFFTLYPPRRVNITLYGASEATYGRLCHFPGGYCRTRRAIELLLERHIDVKINGSLVKANAHELDAIYAIGDDLGVPVSVDTYMLPGRQERGLSPEDQSRLSPEEAAEAAFCVWKRDMLPDELEHYLDVLLERLDHTGDVEYSQAIECQAANCSFSVNWQGELRPCVTLEEPSVSLFSHTVSEAWVKVSSQAKMLKISGTCAHCRRRPLCQNCVGSAYLETGEYDKPPEYLCRFSRRLEEVVRDHTGIKKN